MPIDSNTANALAYRPFAPYGARLADVFLPGRQDPARKQWDIDMSGQSAALMGSGFFMVFYAVKITVK